MYRNLITFILTFFLLTNNIVWAQPQSSESGEFPAPSLVVRPIKFTIGLLEINAEFVDEGVSSPYKGYVLRRSDVALLQTVVDRLPDDFSRECDARIGACIDEVSNCQNECDQRMSNITQELLSTKELLTLERDQHQETRFRYALYGFGGAIVSSLTTVLIIKLVN